MRSIETHFLSYKPDVNAKVIRRNPSVRDDDVHLGLLVGVGLVLHCGPIC